MTGEFIKKHCQFCDRCIYVDDSPLFCGEIDEDGCVSEDLQNVHSCYYGYQPIPHIPRFKVGDVISYELGNEVLTVIDVNDDTYTLQLKGTHGNFNESYTPYKDETENVDSLFNLYVV